MQESRRTLIQSCTPMRNLWCDEAVVEQFVQGHGQCISLSKPWQTKTLKRIKYDYLKHQMMKITPSMILSATCKVSLASWTILGGKVVGIWDILWCMLASNLTGALIVWCWLNLKIFWRDIRLPSRPIIFEFNDSQYSLIKLFPVIICSCFKWKAFTKLKFALKLLIYLGHSVFSSPPTVQHGLCLL